MAFSGTQTTRHGLYGGARQPYGSFAGKTAATDVALTYAVHGGVLTFQPAGGDLHFQPRSALTFQPDGGTFITSGSS